jgi:predicted nucleotidyltransferase
MYLRELSEKFDIPLATVHKHMTQMEKYKILKSYYTKNKKYFKINYDSVIARELIRAKIIEKILLLKSYKSIIKENGLKKIYLFGSANQGILDKNSDIDLAIIVEKKEHINKIEKYRLKIEEEIKSQIDLTIITEEELSSLKNENRQILINILKGTLIYGNIFE